MLVDVMMKIQDHVMQDGDQDETSNIDEKPSISESIPSCARPLRERLERSDIAHGQPTLDVASPVKTFSREFEMLDIMLLTSWQLVYPMGMRGLFREILKHKCNE